MTLVRLAAASLNQTPIDWTGNRARIMTAMDAAREAGARLLCLPELAVSGYGCEDLFFADYVRVRALEELAVLAPATAGLAVAIGVPLEVEGHLYNGAALFADGRLLGIVLKQHLADDGLHYEPRWFRPWPAGKVAEVRVGGETVPVGDLVFDLAGVRVGFEVCRDAWVADRPAWRLAKRGVGVILNPSASHFAFGKQAIRRQLVTDGAKAINGAYVYCNLLGNESGRTIYDGGTLIANGATQNGSAELIEGKRFSYADHTLTVADVEVPTNRAGNNTHGIKSPFDPTASKTALPPADLPPLGASLRQKHDSLEEFSRVVPLGLFDYLRKSGAKGFVLSLSGGADSAATAVLVGLMAKLAMEELGIKGWAARLPAVEGLGEATDTKEAVQRLLHTLYQATENSSETTRSAAETMALALGTDHRAWDVSTLVERYTELASEAVGRDLSWKSDDIALQNIQARVRSPGVWLLANLHGALLLTTGNRSEASVGYATMDGDTSGGLAPIAGVDKAFLLEWLRWMETDGPEGVGPLPALSVINAQQPTAELRPLATGQTDEADLMPYPVLAAIERSAIG